MSTERGEPLKPSWLHILLALAERDLHGSGIARSVLDQSGGSLRLWPATLYGALDELVEAGLIEELSGAAHPEGESERRRYYRILPRGRQALHEEGTRLASLAALTMQRARGG